MFPVLNLGLGQAPSAATYTCPPDAPYDPNAPSAFAIIYAPDLNCMRDARGNTVCSDGMRYPPGCPKTPPDKYFSPGVTPDVITNGMIEGAVPPPKGSSATSHSQSTTQGISPKGNPVLLIGAGALGTAALAAAAYFFILKK
jgi:hypothetical protein